MFASQLGIRLVLLIGKTVPLPAPAEALTALTSVQVINDMQAEGDGFQITFTLGKDKSGDYRLLKSGLLDPDTRVIIGVLLGTKLQPLIDGIIYHHQVKPGMEPGMSRLTVSGRDIGVLLDLKEIDKSYQQQSDSTIVKTVLMNYAQYGIIPETKETSEIPAESSQHGTDLAFIRRLAQRNSFVFYLEPKTMGMTRAYWGPEERSAADQPPLTVNLGTYSNVTSLDFTHDALAPVDVRGKFIDAESKKSMNIPALESLRMPALASKTGKARRTRRLRGTAGKSSSRASAEALAARMNAPYAVTASGELETVRYGGLLRARRQVAVRGAGRTYDGVYLVSRVTHSIEPGKYTQQFELKREGTGALSTMV